MYSSFRLWLRNVVLVFAFNFSNVKVFVPALLIHSGRLSVTSNLSVSTGNMRSSPSAATMVLMGPALLRAVMRTPTASTPSGTVTDHCTTALSPCDAMKT